MNLLGCFNNNFIINIATKIYIIFLIFFSLGARFYRYVIDLILFTILLLLILV